MPSVADIAKNLTYVVTLAERGGASGAPPPLRPRTYDFVMPKTLFLFF